METEQHTHKTKTNISLTRHNPHSCVEKGSARLHTPSPSKGRRHSFGRLSCGGVRAPGASSLHSLAPSFPYLRRLRRPTCVLAAGAAELRMKRVLLASATCLPLLAVVVVRRFHTATEVSHRASTAIVRTPAHLAGSNALAGTGKRVPRHQPRQQVAAWWDDRVYRMAGTDQCVRHAYANAAISCSLPSCNATAQKPTLMVKGSVWAAYMRFELARLALPAERPNNHSRHLIDAELQLTGTRRCYHRAASRLGANFTHRLYLLPGSAVPPDTELHEGRRLLAQWSHIVYDGRFRVPLALTPGSILGTRSSRWL